MCPFPPFPSPSMCPCSVPQFAVILFGNEATEKRGRGNERGALSGRMSGRIEDTTTEAAAAAKKRAEFRGKAAVAGEEEEEAAAAND